MQTASTSNINSQDSFTHSLVTRKRLFFIFLGFVSLFVLYFYLSVRTFEKMYYHPHLSFFSCVLDSSSDECVVSTALRTNNLDLCSKTSSNWPYELECHYIISDRLIKLNKFRSVDCANFSSLIAKNRCFIVNSLKEKNPYLCKNLSGNGFFSDFDSCYEGALSEIIHTASSIEECSIPDYSLVTRNSFNYNKNECLRSLAIRKKDITICNLLMVDIDGCVSEINK